MGDHESRAAALCAAPAGCAFLFHAEAAGLSPAEAARPVGTIHLAARGANEVRIMLLVMLPLARPAMAIAAIQNAVPIWNDFFFPLVFITSDARKTLPQGLTVFMGEFNTEWGVLFAGLTMAAMPIMMLYLALSRQVIAGLTQGAGK